MMEVWLLLAFIASATPTERLEPVSIAGRFDSKEACMAAAKERGPVLKRVDLVCVQSW